MELINKIMNIVDDKKELIWDSTPAKDGFFMPGEEQKHEGSILIWPYSEIEWRSKATPGQKTFIDVTNVLVEYETVNVIVNKGQYNKAKKMLSPKVNLVTIENTASWARDHLPAYVVNKKTKEVRGVCWLFNYWGLVDILNYKGKLPQYIVSDITLAKNFLKHNNQKGYLAPLFLEGGSFHVDGEGTCITTEECLLKQNRNPHYSKQQIEHYLKEYLNVQKVIWLKYGVSEFEMTGGHVDCIINYIKPGKIFMTWSKNPDKRMKTNLEILSKELDAQGRKIEVIKLNRPKDMILSKEEYSTMHKSMVEYMDYYPKMPIDGDYVNMYISNKVVIVPQYGNDLEADKNAIITVKEQFPDRDVVGVLSREFSLSGGNIHCMTQQFLKS